LKANEGVKPIILVVIAKSSLTWNYYCKTDHSVETCHNKKTKVPIVLIITFKSMKHIARTKTQLVKSR
jgi:hypothetical protein